MLKHLLICASLIASATSTVSAQQQEAALEKLEVPGASFDIMLAKPKLGGAVMNFGNAPDALVIRLIGDELAVSFDSVEKMIEALDTLQLPVCAFHVESNDRRRQAPIAVYIVPKGDKVSTVEQ